MSTKAVLLAPVVGTALTQAHSSAPVVVGSPGFEKLQPLLARMSCKLVAKSWNAGTAMLHALGGLFNVSLSHQD